MLVGATTPIVSRSVVLSCRFWFQSGPTDFKLVGLNKHSQSIKNPSSNFASIRWNRKVNSNRSAMEAFNTRALAQPLMNADELIDSVETFIFDCDSTDHNEFCIDAI
ncbi:hypothetical protein K1719_009310 [Acacia pycnantha]|nr:hypothetical protein K1719_009310 [Acacia pycnantha]